MPFDTPSPFPSTGTTARISIGHEVGWPFVNPCEFFLIKVHSAQAVVRGNIFDQPKQLVITSKGNLNHPALGTDDVFAIRRSRAIDKNRAEQLGLSPNLTSLIPATMSQVAGFIDFLRNTQNNLTKLGALIDDDKFLAVISLPSEVVAVAKTVGGLAQCLIQIFVPSEERKPILEFMGDLNIGGDDVERSLRSGYYEILGSRHEQDSLPTTVPAIEVRKDSLLIDGAPAIQYLYVVLDVERVVARTRTMAEGAVWDAKRRKAEQLAIEFAHVPYTDKDEKKQPWLKCRALLQEARALLMTDPICALDEAAALYKADYESCQHDQKCQCAQDRDCLTTHRHTGKSPAFGHRPKRESGSGCPYISGKDREVRARSDCRRDADFEQPEVL